MVLSFGRRSYIPYHKVMANSVLPAPDGESFIFPYFRAPSPSSRASWIRQDAPLLPFQPQRPRSVRTRVQKRLPARLIFFHEQRPRRWGPGWACGGERHPCVRFGAVQSGAPAQAPAPRTGVEQCGHLQALAEPQLRTWVLLASGMKLGDITSVYSDRKTSSSKRL